MDREIGIAYWAERNWNTVDAPEILPMMRQTRQEFDRLMALPGVAAAHAACLAAHAARYQTLMQDLDSLRLAFRLGFLTDSTPPSAAAGRAFLNVVWRARCWTGLSFWMLSRHGKMTARDTSPSSLPPRSTQP
jgi:endonuclease III